MRALALIIATLVAAPSLAEPRARCASCSLLPAGATGSDLTLSGSASIGDALKFVSGGSGLSCPANSTYNAINFGPTTGGNQWWICGKPNVTLAVYNNTTAYSTWRLSDGYLVNSNGTEGPVFNGTAGSGSDAFKVSTNGARWHFGTGASDYASSDGTTVTIATALAVPSGTRFNWDGATASVSSFASSSNMLQFDNELQFIMGTSASGPAVMVGTANVTTADVTSSGASNLQSYTLPANALTTAGRCLRITGWGTALNNANAKTVALDFGSQTIISKILTPSIANTTWKVQAMVCRSGASTQDIYAEAWNPMGTTVSSVDANTVLYQAARTAGTQTETATIVIKGKTTTATTTDVTMDGLTVEIL